MLLEGRRPRTTLLYTRRIKLYTVEMRYRRVAINRFAMKDLVQVILLIEFINFCIHIFSKFLSLSLLPVTFNIILALFRITFRIVA